MTRPYSDAIDKTTAHDPDLAQFAKAAQTHFEDAYTMAFGLGEKLAARRIELHLSQTELAGRAGVPQADVSRIEHGKGNPTIATLEKILTALSLQIDVHPKAGPA